MIKTRRTLVNKERIQAILIDLMNTSYENIKDEEILLCLDCLDVDLYLATTNHDEFDEAIKANFDLDEDYEIIDYEAYRELMEDLDLAFLELHKTSGLFDYFPPGEYKVNGELREQEGEHLAPKGIFYAPYEDALVDFE
jgi:hypothetical protein